MMITHDVVWSYLMNLRSFEGHWWFIKAIQGKWSVQDPESVYNIVSTNDVFVGSGNLKVVMPIIDSNLKVQINPIFFIVFAVKDFVRWNSMLNLSIIHGGNYLFFMHSNMWQGRVIFIYKLILKVKVTYYMGLSLLLARSQKLKYSFE
jgi:hypothetical protein